MKTFGFVLLTASLALPQILGAQLPAPGAGAQWTTPAGDVQGTRFSTLDQINTTNVSRLQEEFHFRTDVRAGHEGAPLVVGRTMYIVSPFPNRLFALDLANGGRLRWVFDPKADPFAQDKACCDIVNRGAVYSNGKIIYNVLDNTTVAVDAVTGRQVWRTKLGDPATGQSMTMAPLVVADKVFVGNSGGEFGIRGFVAALDVNTGREVWRAWSTGTDADVKVNGPDYQPFYDKERGVNLGITTWGGTTLWQMGGGTVWAWLTYDPVLDLLYHGTSNPGVWNADIRPGDNKWGSTVFARNPNTGQARWAYQITPHDAWDYDGVNENIVADLVVRGVPRNAIVRFDRNGFAYTQDRTTGEVLVAEKYANVNWADSIDKNKANGRPNENPGKRPHEGVNVTNICPAIIGGKDQQPAAFSPQTELFYVPMNNVCMDFEALKVIFIEGTPFVGASVIMKPGPGGNRGEFIAWDAATGKKIWRIPERFPVWGGALATAGDVVFYGTLDRWFRAVNARTGEVLFQKQLESGIVGNPMTFIGPDGRQRIAVYSGVGGVAGAVVAGKLSLDDPFAGFGIVNVTRDLKQFTGPGGAVHVFRLH
jgi:PQQ-dependent dehydrogenase (methanol/ethanol family)